MKQHALIGMTSVSTYPYYLNFLIHWYEICSNMQFQMVNHNSRYKRCTCDTVFWLILKHHF